MRTDTHLLPKLLRALNYFLQRRSHLGFSSSLELRGPEPGRAPQHPGTSRTPPGARSRARARAAASRARRAPGRRAAGGSEVVGCGVCAASAVARAAARRAGRQREAQRSAASERRVGTARRRATRRAGSGRRAPVPEAQAAVSPGSMGAAAPGRARAGSAVLCAAPGRAARGAGAPLCPRRAGGGAGRPVQGRGGKVAGGLGCLPPPTQRPLSWRKTQVSEGPLSKERTFRGHGPG